MNWFIKIIVALAIFLSLPGISFTQKKPQLNIIGRVLSADGLMTDWIQYITKDSNGFMWFTFDHGFNRWDGYEAKRFPGFLSDTSFNSSSRFCRPILEYDRRTLFIGTLANGLIKLDRTTDQYTRYSHDPDDTNSIASNNVYELLLDSDGRIWIGSDGGGLSLFDPILEEFRNYRILHSDTNNTANNSIRSMCIDSYDKFWIGTSKGLYLFDRGSNDFIEIQTDIKIQEGTDYIECMQEDYLGNMWFGTRNGLMKYDRGTGTWEHINTSNPDKSGSGHDIHVVCMAIYNSESKHQLWFGTIAGLKMYDIRTGTLTHFNSKNGYPDITNTGPVSYLYIDESDILWAGLEGLTLINLVDYPFQPFFIHSYPDSIEYLPASCFYKDKNEHLWVGSFTDGLYEYDEHFNFIGNYRLSSGNHNLAENGANTSLNQIYEDHLNRIWMLSGPTGICLFDLESKTFQPLESDISLSGIRQILVDKAERIWLATNDGLIEAKLSGIAKLECQARINYSITDILIDSKDHLWAVTRNNGVIRVDLDNMAPFSFKTYYHKDYRRRYTVEYNARYTLEDNEGNIWFMSEESLFSYDRVSDSIIPEDNFNKPNDRKIYSFTCDKNGTLWMIWAYGLVYYNPEDSTKDKLFRMSFYDGLPFSFYIRNSFYQDDQGYLYCGGQATINRGFLRFHPDSIRGPNKKLPPIVITDFRVKNNPVDLDSNINYIRHIGLEYDQNFFSFKFSALDYKNPLANNYAYMLDGIDEDWVFNSVRRTANYTSVPPGHYTFRVKGTNNHWYWNEEGTSLAITIHPPPWRTWWAYAIYGIALFALLFALRQYDRRRQRLKQALELEHVEAEKLKELDSMKSRFFANISHEFRTPLTLILGPLDKLLSKTDDKDCFRDLNIMHRNARRLQRLINQLLSLSKLESGQMKLHAQELNIVQLVRGYAQSFESLARQKGIKFEFKADQAEIMAWVDKEKMEKILYNLLSNAFKFTGGGGSIKVQVARRKTQDTGHAEFIPSGGEGLVTRHESGHRSQVTDHAVCISVSDTGPGIDADKLPHIFDRFYQAEDEYAGDQEGTGIGLALAQELVKLHHGEIRVKSEAGRGSEFTVVLPVGERHLGDEERRERREERRERREERRENEFTIEPITNHQSPTTNHQSPTTNHQSPTRPDKPVLLVVEDNDDLRSYIRSYLDDDYNLHEAVDGEVGLSSALEKVPDLIISDVMMPKMDGYQLCHAIKTDERTSHIPVILLTAKAAKEDKIEGLETGADDFLTKPFDPSELLVRVRNLIEQRKALREKFLKEINIYPQAEARDPISMDERFLHKAYQAIEAHLDDADYSVDQFMAEMAMSKVQLYRKLKSLLNLSANEFIRSIRLSHAARMLRDKSDNIAQIAYAVGFNNPSYFAECFKKQFGMSPREYTKS